MHACMHGSIHTCTYTCMSTHIYGLKLLGDAKLFSLLGYRLKMPWRIFFRIKTQILKKGNTFPTSKFAMFCFLCFEKFSKFEFYIAFFFLSLEEVTMGTGALRLNTVMVTSCCLASSSASIVCKSDFLKSRKWVNLLCLLGCKFLVIMSAEENTTKAAIQREWR